MTRVKVFLAKRVPIPPHLVRPRRRRRAASFAVAALCHLLPLGSVVALSFVSLPSPKYAIFSSTMTPSSLVVENQDTKIKGKSTVEVKLDVRNGASTVHEGDVTVQLYDAGGALLVEQTKATGPIATQGVASLTFTFSQANLAAQFHEVFVILRETT